MEISPSDYLRGLARIVEGFGLDERDITIASSVDQLQRDCGALVSEIIDSPGSRNYDIYLKAGCSQDDLIKLVKNCFGNHSCLEFNAEYGAPDKAWFIFQRGDRDYHINFYMDGEKKSSSETAENLEREKCSRRVYYRQLDPKYFGEADEYV